VRPSHTARSATGLIGAPVSLRHRCETRCACLRVDEPNPSTEFTNVKPVAPASSAAPAIATMSVTLGDNFANIGAVSPIDSTTARMAERVASSECANTLPRASTLGHERFTSTATKRCATDFNGRAAAAYSSAVRPQSTRSRAHRVFERGQIHVRSTRRHPDRETGPS